MNLSIIVRRSVAALALLGCMGPGSAWGADQPNQTLDQVDAFSATKVLEMAFDQPPPPFSELALGSPAGLAACKLAASGLYCLASSSGVQVVRQWKLPLAGPGGSPVDRFSCADSGLGLDGGSCTGLTVDLSGAIWVAGKKGNNYSLVKLVKPATLPNGCTNGWAPLTGAQSTPLCAREFATGLGALADLDAVDGEVAYSSTSPNVIEPGILALNRSNSDASLYFDLGIPGLLLHSFGNWNLQVGERLLSTTLLQRKQTIGQVTSVVGNYILAATTGGRILSIDFANPTAIPPAMARPVFTIAQAQPPVAINSGSCTNGTTTCIVGGATLTSVKPFYVKAPLFGFSGLGLNGSTPGEIAINENVHVQFQGPDPYTVTAIQIVYLFNGPEYGDRAEIAKVTVDGSTPYTLTVDNTADNAAAVWSGPGIVTNCSPTTSSGAGCFLITNPFPAPVSALDFTAVHGNAGFGGTSTNDSDYAIGKIEAGVDYSYGIRTSFKTGRVYASDRNARNVRALVPGAGVNYLLTQLLPESNGILSTSPTAPDGLTVAPGNSVDLSQCPDATQKCTVILGSDPQNPAVTVDSVKLKDGSPSGVTVYQIKGLIDCRYAPKDCADLLGVAPIGTSPFDNSEYMEGLISQGIIIPLDPSKPSLAKNRYRPAAQLLNVTPMLPEDVTSLFSESGGLPPLHISRTYRGQAQNSFRFDALFYKTAQGQTFVDTLVTDVKVAQLSSTGVELGCNQGNVIPYSELRKLDVLTRLSETYRSVSDFYRAAANDYRDTIVNDGCGTTKGKVPALSLFPINMEIAPDTYGPQSTSNTQSVTVNNDAVFARLVETLYDDLNRSRSQLACTTIDGGTSPPLSSIDCSGLASKWSTGKNLLNSCISAAFIGQSATTITQCNAFRSQLATTYGGALPLTAASADPANRLGEQKARVATLTRLFDERFMQSILLKGWCREKTAPNSYKGCPAPAW